MDASAPQESNPTGEGNVTPVLGVALGGGGARGFSHIGVLRGLEELGIVPEVVCGTSMGAVVGAAYLTAGLDRLEKRSLEITGWDVVRYIDLNFSRVGGLVRGQRIVEFLQENFGGERIEDLPRPFGVVAADLDSGEEVWLREGPIWEAVRASLSIPGIFAPVRQGDRWLLDGGIVNPVPITLCRAMGADRVLAVDINVNLVSQRLVQKKEQAKVDERKRTRILQFLKKLSLTDKDRLTELISQTLDPKAPPGMYEVLIGAINVMQERIARGRLIEAPPDLLLTPEVGQIRTLEFDRAAEGIEAGRAAVARHREEILKLVSPAS